MRLYCIFSLALIVSSGCTLPGIPGAPRFGQNTTDNASQFEQIQQVNYQAEQKKGFTANLVQYLSPSTYKKSTPQNTVKINKAYNELDPISLSHKSGPATPDLLLSMAQMSDRAGNVAHARTMYQKVLQANPMSRDAMLGLARLEDREGNMQEALQIYQQAASSYPQDAKVLNDLALCYARNEQMPKSAQLLEQAIRLDPQKQLYRNNIAKVLIELNYIDHALGHMAAVHPAAVAQYNLGIMLNERGRGSEAIPFLANAAKMDPQLNSANFLIAQITNNEQLIATNQSASNDEILPTPANEVRQGPGFGYPSTGVNPIKSIPFPAETARVPVQVSPESLPSIH